MFKGNSFLQIFQAGGFTMYILLFCSVLSLAVIVGRLIYYRKRSRRRRAEFMLTIREALEKGNTKKVIDVCKNTDTPFSNVVSAGLSLQNPTERELSHAMEREVAIETTRLERFTAIVGTIGSIAVYIGLFGTVLGIIRAFEDISMGGVKGTNVIIGGISEALVCTATGLCVAIPAVVAYNYFIKRIDNFVTDMELCASEIKDLRAPKQK